MMAPVRSAAVGATARQRRHSSATTAGRSRRPARPCKVQSPTRGGTGRNNNVRQSHRQEIPMPHKHTRRKFMAATAAGAALAAVKSPAPAIAQNAPFKLGLLTVKTGPLAQGGIQMEQGIVTFLKEKNYTFAGRKVEFI